MISLRKEYFVDVFFDGIQKVREQEETAFQIGGDTV